MEARNGRNFAPGTCNLHNKKKQLATTILYPKQTIPLVLAVFILHRGNTSQRAPLSLPPHRIGGLFMSLHYI